VDADGRVRRQHLADLGGNRTSSQQRDNLPVVRGVVSPGRGGSYVVKCPDRGVDDLMRRYEGYTWFSVVRDPYGRVVSNYFNKLKGFQRSPAGLEWQIWKRLHLILTAGTLLPLLASASAYVLDGLEPATQNARAVEQFFYVMVGLVVLHWALVLTLAIGCAIVMLMKGPAYVADAYEMEELPLGSEKHIQR
jgi:hypothetical protein